MRPTRPAGTSGDGAATRRGSATGLRALGALAGVCLLAGCASASPVTALDPAPGDVDVSAPVETFGTLLGEVYAVAVGAEGPAGIVSDGATVDVATAELAAALPLGDDAVAFAAATAFEQTRAGGDPAVPADVEAVEVETREPEVIGEVDGDAVASVAVVVRVTPSSGPVTELTSDYVVVVDGETLLAVQGGDGIDSGVGTRSPTGAALRFVDLVRVGDLDAATYFSDGVNTSTTELEVLARAVTDVDVRVVEVPQARTDGAEAAVTHVVYALDADARVVGRFEVTTGTPGDRTTVVYTPTS